jgi:hypothetical protein
LNSSRALPELQLLMLLVLLEGRCGSCRDAMLLVAWIGRLLLATAGLPRLRGWAESKDDMIPPRWLVLQSLPAALVARQYGHKARFGKDDSISARLTQHFSSACWLMDFLLPVRCWSQVLPIARTSVECAEQRRKALVSADSK